MKRGTDLRCKVPGLVFMHQNKPRDRVATHHHVSHELFLPLQGDIVVVCNQQRLLCQPGKMLFIPAETEHRFESLPATHGERLIVLIEKASWVQFASDHQADVVAAPQLLKEIAFYILTHPQTSSIPALCQVLIQVAQASLAFHSGLMGVEISSKDPRIRSAVAYIHEHYRERILLEDIAVACALSVRSLNRLFQREIAATPKQVLANYRIAQAQALLKTGTRNVTETCFEVGYQSLSQFVSTYRTITGRLPSDDRAS